jgi:hypothetical protein
MGLETPLATLGVAGGDACATVLARRRKEQPGYLPEGITTTIMNESGFGRGRV